MCALLLWFLSQHKHMHLIQTQGAGYRVTMHDPHSPGVEDGGEEIDTM